MLPIAKCWAITGLLCAGLLGCQKPTPPTPAQLQTHVSPPPPLQEFSIPAGVPLAASSDPKRWQNLIAAHTFVPRKDPFALTFFEQGFDNRQEAERLALVQNGFSDNLGASLDESTSNVIVEPQPFRRLAGVLIGDSVLAIIDMGNGRPAEIVRPGQRIAGTPWTVVSIDQDKAVLRRGGNILPREVVVQLQGSPSGARGPVATPGRPAAVPGVPTQQVGGGSRRGGGD